MPESNSDYRRLWLTGVVLVSALAYAGALSYGFETASVSAPAVVSLALGCLLALAAVGATRVFWNMFPGWSHPSAYVPLSALALVWLVFLADWMWMYGALTSMSTALAFLAPLVFATAVPICLESMLAASTAPPIRRYAVWSLCFIPLWQFGVYLTDALVFDSLRVNVARLGLTTAFLIGLMWVVWGVETASRYYERLRRQGRGKLPGHEEWNPLDLKAWYYGERSPKLRQSVTTLFAYTMSFALLTLIVTSLGGCSEIYEMPAGGGEQKQIAQTVKVQKVIKKKFVINPFSAIVFNPPPIDEVKLQLLEITKHAYAVGYGAGDGAGFAGGTKRGKVRFIRLEYAGGDWNQDFGVGADLNMLIEYGARTSHPVANRTESRKVAQLQNFPIGKSPPLVYMTGERDISLSKSEIKILREYLTDKHGMLFGDNGGSSRFHQRFFAMMRQVLPNIEPVRVPLDDNIHRVPYQIPFLPYVAPHGGRDAWGWKLDGRWVCYYHPGDIGDAWSDEHAGVRPEIWEACYQLGTNVIFYAHVEYNKWLDARKQE